jgi:hypothetical protein
MPLTHTAKQGISLASEPKYGAEQLRQSVSTNAALLFLIVKKPNCKIRLKMVEVCPPHPHEDGIPEDDLETAVIFTATIEASDVKKCCDKLRPGARVNGWYNEKTGIAILWP